MWAKLWKNKHSRTTLGSVNYYGLWVREFRQIYQNSKCILYDSVITPRRISPSGIPSYMCKKHTQTHSLLHYLQ